MGIICRSTPTRKIAEVNSILLREYVTMTLGFSQSATSKVITGELAEQVIVRLEAKHSPEQISRVLARTGQRFSTSAVYKPIGKTKNPESGRI